MSTHNDMQREPTQRPRRSVPRRSILRALLVFILLLVGAPLLIAAFLIAALQTDAGRSMLATVIEDAVSEPEGLQLTIGRLEGPLPHRLLLRDVELQDPQGRLVVVDRALLHWRPLALLQRRIEVVALEADSIDLQRLPAGGPEEEARPSQRSPQMALPELPVSIDLQRLHVADLSLGEAIAGTPARLRIDGHSRIDRAGALDAELSVHRLDHRQGQINAKFALAAGGNRLTAQIEGSEPPGGLVASLLDLPNRPAVSISLDGDGPPEGWHGRLRLLAEETAELTADLHLESLQPLALQVDGRAEAEALLPPNLAPLTSPGLDFSARLKRSDDGTTLLEGFRLAGPAGELTATASLEAARDAFSADAELVIADAAPLLPLIEPMSFAEGRVRLRAQGSLGQPRITLDASLSDLLLPQAALGEVFLHARAEPSAPLDDPNAAIDAEFSLVGDSLVLLDPRLADALEGRPRIEAAGRYQLSERHLSLSSLEAALGSLALTANGELSLADGGPAGEMDLGLRHPELRRFSGLAGTDLSGELSLDAQVDLAADGSLEARLESLTDQLNLGIPIADAVLGERPGLTATIRRSTDQRLHVDQLRLDAATAVLTAHALFSPDFAEVDAGYQLGISALEPLGDVLNQPLAGTVEVAGTAVGNLASPHIVAQLHGQSLMVPGDFARELTADLDLNLEGAGPKGSFRLDGQGSYGPVEASTDFALAEARLVLDQLSLRLGDAAQLAGNLDLPLDGTPGSGRLEGEAARLDVLAALFEVEAGGSLRLDAELSPDGPRQSLDGQVVLTRPRLGPANTPSLSGERLAIDLALRDLLEAPQLRADVASTDLRAGEARIRRLAVEASGGLDALSIGLEADGEAADEPLRLQGDARIGVGETVTQIDLQSLEAVWGAETARLLTPARARIAPGDLRLDDLELALFGGRLAGAARQQGESVTADLELSDIPLARLARLTGSTNVEGVLSGELSLSGRMNAPRGRLRLLADDFAFASEAQLSDRPPLDIRAEAELEPGLLRAEALFEGFAENPLSFRGELPLQVSLQPFSVATIADRELNARLQWNGDMAPVMALMPVDTIRLTGRADIDLRAYGTLAAPRLGGQVALSDARYENFTSGTLLQPMELLLTGAGNALTLERLDARDGGDGRIEGRGTLVWLGEDGVEADLRVNLANMRLAQRDDVTARLSGELDLIGNLFERADLTGRLRNDFIEVRLVDALPPSVAEIQVVEVWEGRVPEPQDSDDSAPASASPLFLDVDIDLPRRVFVRGRGLESEWAGSFKVAGNASNPQVSGRLQPLRGEFVVIGKTFVLDEGAISLPVGAPDLDPELDLRAIYSGSGFQAIVGVTGTASHPEVALSSEPELPEDEILSRILFNKTSANLTPLEAVELADAATSLATGGPGVTGLMRRAIGVDVLGFQPGANEDDPGAVEVGTYVGEGVYVGVQQGLGSGSTGVTVEVDITDQIKAHSDVGADGRSRAGVRWQMDY